MSMQGVTLSQAAEILFGPAGKGRRVDTQTVLDAAAHAQCPVTKKRLLPWRAHLFHRAQGGIWVCIDRKCNHRDQELVAEGSDWGFGAVWLKQRDQCSCGAPIFELFACNECGAPFLMAGLVVGASARLVPFRESDEDDFAVDFEPDPDSGTEMEEKIPAVRGTVVLAPAQGDSTDRFVNLDDWIVFDNAPPEGVRSARLALIEDDVRRCCPGAAGARLAAQRFGPPFFMGNAVPTLIETLAPPLDQPGLPMGGRRALTFSDSRQGTARLAAKLQQEAERALTRSFLYHAVQEGRGPEGEERVRLERKLKLFQNDPDEFADDIIEIELKLGGAAKPVLWNDLIDRFARQESLREFAAEVWSERAFGGRELAKDPKKLAEMFLYRELFRRPKVQNNVETMGLARLSFPKLEQKARSANLPSILAKAGVDAEGWVGLALAAVDFVFRDQFAIEIKQDLIRLVNPRGGWFKSVCRPGLAPHDRPSGSRPWPGPVPQSGIISRLQNLVYTLIDGDWQHSVDQDYAREVLSALWSLITNTVAKDIGGGVFQLDFQNAAVIRVEQGWFCPLTRRIFGYSPAGRSPYDANQRLLPLILPKLLHTNAGGLDPIARKEVMRWCQSDSAVAVLRRKGLWTDLHDRIATYAPFLRAQEHSAQIERPVLAIYEERFKTGRINLLNCSTTMEMGVDIPNVRLVVNANVPPAVSNYRQRVGRAGRRDEPWAFGITFCRDLPMDRIVFDNPTHFLSAPISAPSVRLDSPGLVARHVHAALLAAFLRAQLEGFNVKASTGAFFGATEDVDKPISSDAPADAFLDALRGEWARGAVLASDLTHLTRSTVLEERNATHLAAETAEIFATILGRWRAEYSELLARSAATSEDEIKKAFANKAKRMRGEFLLGDLARCGFTPSYGFPVDVVSFDHLSGHNRDRGNAVISFGERRGGASRTLDVAIREYAPGGDVVVDGLVHRSEGVMPAWGTMADDSRLEDLQYFWECRSCRTFGVVRIVPNLCPYCNTPGLDWKRSLRPVGFLGRRVPHTGYENLGHIPYEMPRLSAAGASWQALPDPDAGRMRADPGGQVITIGAGSSGKGYALCLVCGRAEVETEETPGFAVPLPKTIQRHKPLAEARNVKLLAN